MLEFCAQVAIYQIAQGSKFIIENPAGSMLWWTKCFNNLLSKQGVKRSTLHVCAFGVRDPSGYYNYKPTSLTRNVAEGVLDPGFEACPLKKARASRVNRANANHKNQTLEGNAPGYGSRAKLAQVCILSC